MKKSTKTEKERVLPLINFFAETLKDILENGTVKVSQMARATGIPSPHLSEMKAGRRRITPENDLRISRFLGMEPGFFLRLQVKSDLEKAQRENADEIEAIEPLAVESESA